MNVVKYYRIVRSGEGRKVQVVKVRIHPRKESRGRGVSEADAIMIGKGFTRRRPFPPHNFPEQQPGYHQPSEAQRRRVRQAERKAA